MGSWPEAHARFPMYNVGSFIDELSRTADSKALGGGLPAGGGLPTGTGLPASLNPYSYEVDGQRYSIPLDYDPYALFSSTDTQGLKTDPTSYYGSSSYRADSSYAASGSSNAGPLNFSQQASSISNSNTPVRNGMSNVSSGNYTDASGALNMVSKEAKDTDIVASALSQSQVNSDANKFADPSNVNIATNLPNQYPASNGFPNVPAAQPNQVVRPEDEDLVDESNKNGLESLLYKCTICHKKYSTKKSLQRHSAIHPENKSHECEICSKNFGTMTHLMTHLKTHMKESYFCSFCDERYASITALKTHMGVHAVDNMLNIAKTKSITGITKVSNKDTKATKKEAEKKEDTTETEVAGGQKRPSEDKDIETPDKRRKTNDTKDEDQSTEGTDDKQGNSEIKFDNQKSEEANNDISQDLCGKTDADQSADVAGMEKNMKVTFADSLPPDQMVPESDICIRTDHENIKLNKRVEVGENGNEMYIRMDIIEDGYKLNGEGEDGDVEIKKEPVSDDEIEQMVYDKQEESIAPQFQEPVPVSEFQESEDQIKPETAIEETPEMEGVVSQEEETEETAGDGEEGGEEEEGEEDDDEEEDDSDEEETVMPCGFCNEKFTEPEELLIHLEMHRDTNTYSYEVDGKIVTATFNDNADEESEEEEEEEKTPKSRKKKSAGGQEVSPIPPVIDPVTGEKVYKCNICPKEYSRANSLKRHLILHTGEKPHQCPHCPRKFALVSYLTEHVKTHTGKLPFQCKICKKYFNRLANMKVHMGIHVKEKQDKEEQLKFQKQLAAGGIDPNVLPGDHKGIAEVMKDLFATGDAGKGEGILSNSDIVSGAIQLANKSGKPNDQILLVDGSKGGSNSAVLLKNNSGASGSSSSSANQSLISLKQQIIEKAMKKLGQAGSASEKMAAPEDSDEMNLFKPYLTNYLAEGGDNKDAGDDKTDTESDKKSRKSKRKSAKSGGKMDESESGKEESGKDTPKKGKKESKPTDSDDLASQVMQIINFMPGAEESKDTVEQAEGSEGEGKEESKDEKEGTENTDVKSGLMESLEKSLYTYVLEGKTYQIPLETYTSLIKLDRQLESEGAKNEVLIQQFGMITKSDETGKKLYTCELCQKSYSRSNSLRRHLLVHTGEKAYACDLCDKKFSIKSYLTAHRKIHSGETPFGCTLCFKQFNRVSNLRAHMLVHTGLKPHSCEVCGKLFNLSSNLKRHMTIHSGLKPHVCSVCGKEFGLSSSLKEHMRVHTGENPYKCELCGKVFKQHSNFRRHKSIHSGEKRHVCKICNKAFNQSGSLKRHYTIHPETAGEVDFESQLDAMEGMENDDSILEGESMAEEGDSMLEEGEIDPEDIKKENPDYIESENISDTINRIVNSHSENDSASEVGLVGDAADIQQTKGPDSTMENYYSQLQTESAMIKQETNLDDEIPSNVGKIDVKGLTGKKKRTPKKSADTNDQTTAEKSKKDKRKSKPSKVASFDDLSNGLDETDNFDAYETPSNLSNPSKTNTPLEQQMPHMNNIPGEIRPNVIQSNVISPNSLSKEDQLKQMEWYHKQYNT